MFIPRERVEVINVSVTHRREGWLIIYPDGRIVFEVEDDGNRVCYGGLRSYKEGLTLDTLRSHQYARHYVNEVERVLARLGSVPCAVAA